MSVPPESKALSAIKLALLTNRLRANEHDMELLAAEPIAVIGLACRLPAGLETPEAFWDFLEGGGDAISEVPAERWDTEAYFDLIPRRPARSIRDSADSLRTSTSSIRWYSGLRHAKPFTWIPSSGCCSRSLGRRSTTGRPLESLRGSKTGVFFGICSSDYGRMQLGTSPTGISAQHASGTAPSIPPGRFSYPSRPARTEHDDRHRLLVVAGGGAPRGPEPARRRLRSRWRAVSSVNLTPDKRSRFEAWACCHPTAGARRLMRGPTGSSPAKAAGWWC